MADITMVVFESTRILGLPNWQASAGFRLGNAADPGKVFLFPNDGKTFIIMYADGGAGDKLTFTGKNDKYGRASADLDFDIATAKTGIVGPFDPGLWNDSDGMVKFTLTTGHASSYLLAVRISNSGLNGV